MLQKIISGGQTGADQAALDAVIKLGILHCGWIYAHNIEILNVAGSRVSKDPEIYKPVKDLIEALILLNTMDYATAGLDSPLPVPPQSMNEAVERLMSEFTLRDKTKIAKMDNYDFYYLQLNLGRYIRDKFRIRDGNKELMESCREISGNENINEDDASSVIVEELWKKLKKSHSLRLIE